MFQDSFSHSIFRKYHSYFAALFSNIYLDRTLDNGSKTARIQVPIHYAGVDKMLARVMEDPNIDRKDAIFLPAMAFEMIDLQYNGARKKTTMTKMAQKIEGDPNRFKTSYVPVPYDIHFRLYIAVKNVDDGHKIVEQIIPYFTPDLTSVLEIIPEMGISHEIPLVLTSIVPDNKIPQSYIERVSRIWVMDFVLQGYFYGPVKKQPIIKFTEVTYAGIDPQAEVSTIPFLRVTSQPGLDANGNPTTDINETVPYLTIFVDDNYNYIDQVIPINNGPI